MILFGSKHNHDTTVFCFITEWNVDNNYFCYSNTIIKLNWLQLLLYRRIGIYLIIEVCIIDSVSFLINTVRLKQSLLYEVL